MSRDKIYFASDLHLGLPGYAESRDREKLFVKWLDEIKHDAQKIFLLGDIFDFWFEWKKVVPRGFTRFLGKIAELSDSGIEIHFFIGNHDVWMFDYLQEELNVIIHREPFTLQADNTKMYLAHGDGLGPGDGGYKMLKRIFHNKILQWLFARVHPNCAVWIANRWSVSSRYSQEKPVSFGKKEWLYQHAESVLEKEHFNYFIFGHRHIPEIIEMEKEARYVNLGDWISCNTYAVYHNNNVELKSYI